MVDNSVKGNQVKPVARHFRSDPPRHRARYYLAFAGAMLVVAMAYVLFTLLRHIT